MMSELINQNEKSLATDRARLLKLKNECSESIRNIDAELKRREQLTHHVGSIWKNEAGEWFGMTSEGETGPWQNRHAADAAAKEMFKSANLYNKRKYPK